MQRTLLGFLATLVLLLTACSDLESTATQLDVDGTLTPADGATGVSVHTDVSIQFVDPLAGAIDPAEVEATFTLTELDDEGEAVDGGAVDGATTFSQDADFLTTYTFDPTDRLDYETTYEAYVAADAGLITDGGDELSGDLSWTFTTAAMEDEDGDGIPNDEDNCPEVPNPGQEDDYGEEGVGNACEDSDGDGLTDDEDPFPTDPDGDGDGVDDGEDPDPTTPGFAPEIVSFTATPETLEDTDTAELTWDVERHHDDASGIDAEEEGFEVSIDTGIGSVGASGSHEVSPTEDTTYTLTASNIYGEATANVTVTVVDGDGDGVPDGIDNCPGVANPDQGDMDEDGVGDACDDDRDGDGVPNDEDPDPDTKGHAPTIAAFDAEPSVVSDLDGVVLSWNVEPHHDDPSVDEGLALSIDNGVGDVTDQDDVTVMTSAPIFDTTFTLTASNIYGEATATVDVTVEDQDGDGIPDDEDDGYDGSPGEVPGCDLEELDGALCLSYGDFEFDYHTGIKKGDPIVDEAPEIVNGVGPYKYWFEASDADGFFKLQEDGTIVRGSSGNGSDFKDWQLRVYVEDLGTGKVASVVLDFNLVD